MTRICLLASLAALLIAAPAWGAAPADPEDWDAIYEANPLTTDSATQGDDHIRDAKIQTRRRLNVEHQFSTLIGSGSADSDDDGLHRMGSARCFIKDSAPTRLELDSYDNATGLDLVNGELLLSISGGAAGGFVCDPNTTDCSDLLEYQGQGRCWFDRDGADGIDNTADDYTLYVYDDRTADVDVADALAQWELADRGSGLGPNLLYNGDFEVMPAMVDGEACIDLFNAGGPPENAGVPNGLCDIDGATAAYPGWDLVTTGHLESYQATDFSEGTGYSIEISGDADADGISQELVLPGGSRTYAIIARVLPTAGGDICKISTLATAGTTNVEVSSPAAAAWTTLYGEFVTTAGALDTVEIHLAGSAAADICEWDHVAVREVNPSAIPIAGDFIHETTMVADVDLCPGLAGVECDGDIDIVEGPTFIVPTNGCYVSTTAQFGTTIDTGLDADFDGLMVMQMSEGGGAYATVSAYDVEYDILDLSPNKDHVIPWFIRAIGGSLVAGQTYQFKAMYDGNATANPPTSWDVFGTQAAARLITEFNCPGD